MILTEYALKKMGFAKNADEARIEAKFTGLHIYRLYGINVEEDYCEKFRTHIDGVDISYALGSDLDKICNSLLGDRLTTDTQDWEKSKDARPPYLAILVGPTEAHIGMSDHYLRKDDILITYESFQAAKDDLARMSELVVPRLVSAIECNLSVLSQETELVFVDYLVSGKSSVGETVNDLRYQGSISIKIARAVQGESLRRALEISAKHGRNFNSRAANFFNLASQEDDLLKRFLYYFLSIEITTHHEFLEIDHDRYLKEKFSPPERVLSSAHRLFRLRNEHMKSLKDRFIWCSICIWKEMNEDDIAAFRAVVDTRNDISHGSLSSPSIEQVEVVKKLARKVISTNTLASK